MKEEVFNFNVYGFDEEKWEALAITEDGKEIIIDPFVTDDWKWNERDKYLGHWRAKGFWNKYGVFLPTEIIALRSESA